MEWGEGEGLPPSCSAPGQSGKERKTGRRVQQVCQPRSLSSAACVFEQSVNKVTLLLVSAHASVSLGSWSQF